MCTATRYLRYWSEQSTLVDLTVSLTQRKNAEATGVRHTKTPPADNRNGPLIVESTESQPHRYPQWEEGFTARSLIYHDFGVRKRGEPGKNLRRFRGTVAVCPRLRPPARHTEGDDRDGYSGQGLQEGHILPWACRSFEDSRPDGRQPSEPTV